MDEASLKAFEWVEYVFVKGKGWTHENELKPGDQFRLKDGSWETVEPDRIIETTHEHPFYVKDKGWTPVNQIKPGDLLRTENGWVEVKKVMDTGRTEIVYNLRVEDYHTYFVGSEEWGFAVWAHNTCLLEIVQQEGHFVLRYPATQQFVRAGNSNAVLTFGTRQQATDWIFRYAVHAPTHTTVAALTPAIEAEILNSLPQYVRGAGGIADNAHGVLVVTIRGETRLYRLGSCGPNIAEGYAGNLAPANAPQLVQGFTRQNFDHVEGSAGALIRHLVADGEQVSTARLFLNVDALCAGELGCGANLTNMLPVGTRMQVFGTRTTQAGQRSAIDLGTFGRTGTSH